VNLKEKAANLPEAAGVYLMKDEAGTVIYVGKAKSLRDRVPSYFQDRPSEDPKMEVMKQRIADFDFVEADSEVDALLMEMRLIKDIRPRYNTQLKDDKSYPFLEITMKDDFPRVHVTRDPVRGSKLYGPFLDATGLHRAMELLQKIFRFRTCNMDIRADDKSRRYTRPCILHSIRMCHAPCAGHIGKRDYADIIRGLRKFLEGKRKDLIAGLQKQMEEYSRDLQYEKAAGIRDRIRAIGALSKRGLAGSYFGLETIAVSPEEATLELQRSFSLGEVPRLVEGIDVATIQGSETTGSVVSFVDGRPFKSNYRRYRIKRVAGGDDCACIGEVTRRRYSRLKSEKALMPDVLLVDGGRGQLNAALEALRGIGVEIGLVVSLAKREEELYSSRLDRPLKLARNNPALRLLQYVRDEAHRFARHYHHILRRKRTFGKADLKVRRIKKMRT